MSPANLPEVLTDQDNYKRGLMGLGVEEDAIIIATEIDYPTFQRIFEQIKQVVESNFNSGLESNVFLIYGGHGILEFTTYAVCTRVNIQRPIEWRFPIEREIRKLSRTNGIYVISVLDCCREKWPPRSG